MRLQLNLHIIFVRTATRHTFSGPTSFRSQSSTSRSTHSLRLQQTHETTLDHFVRILGGRCLVWDGSETWIGNQVCRRGPDTEVRAGYL
jgi:hypothetical protein